MNASASLDWPAPRVVVADSDAAMRRLLRVGLELAGAEVMEAATAAEAEGLAAGGGVHAAVLGEVADDGAPEAAMRLAGLVDGGRVIVMRGPGGTAGAEGGDDPLPTGMHRVGRGEVEAAVAVLGLRPAPPAREPLLAVTLLREASSEVAESWRELCRWDPMLPPDTQPPIATAFVVAVAEALGRPQPLGWGADPEIEKVTEVFATAAGDLEIAVGQLVCLREALARYLRPRVPRAEEQETLARLHMVLDRAVGVAVGQLASRLADQAYVDVLTGLHNRRAFERDLRREMGRAARYDRKFSVLVIDVEPPVRPGGARAERDADLRALASAALDVLRSGDDVYRLGASELVILLPEAPGRTADVVAARLGESLAPSFGWGVAAFPTDGNDAESLLAAAARRVVGARTSSHA